MKAQIHPEYHSDAKISCLSCGYEVKTGSTMPEIKVELCFKCHPFYTGKQNLVDTGGRVDRFARLKEKTEKASASATSKKAKTAKRAAAKAEKKASKTSVEA
ncbi:MAG TPA: 50S ribosomal protein L31 [Verrucomicrobiae bacterium]|nr:50S ribosomal protein L31 [Verrucomicrobiae bacterium]